MKIEELVRDNIKLMQPYSSARQEYKGDASIFLDANENPYQSGYNRYPDPLQVELKKKISGRKNIPVENIFLGNGSDEAIDLLIRIFCRPDKDRIIICPPTYGMYEVCASVNDVKVKQVSLNSNFQLDMDTLLQEIKRPAKLLFICSPNNPTGNSINSNDIKPLLDNFKGIVVVDEAYIDYTDQPSFIRLLDHYNNLVVLQTLSKAWGLAGLRLGMAFASEPIITYLNKIKPPYNINAATQLLAMEALDNTSLIANWTKTIIEQREWLRQELLNFPFIKTIYPSDANFLFIKARDAVSIYHYLKTKGVIVRYKDGLRITIGTPPENKALIETLKLYEESFIY